jgi:hypothetical protein
MGIEPTRSAWEAEVLPLNYTRTLCALGIITGRTSSVKLLENIVISLKSLIKLRWELPICSFLDTIRDISGYCSQNRNYII